MFLCCIFICETNGAELKGNETRCTCSNILLGVQLFCVNTDPNDESENDDGIANQLIFLGCPHDIDNDPSQRIF